MNAFASPRGCGDAADVIENPVLNLLPNPLANLRTMETQAVAVAGEVADADDPIARNALDEARQRPPGKPSSETLYNVQDKAPTGTSFEATLRRLRKDENHRDVARPRRPTRSAEPRS